MADTIKTRILLKTDTTANWEKAINFIPQKGEICIYSDRFQLEDGSYVPGIKVGDGTSFINELEFMSEDYISNSEIDELIGTTGGGGGEGGSSFIPKTYTIAFPDYTDDEIDSIMANVSLTASNSRFYYTTFNEETNCLERLNGSLYDLFGGNPPIGCTARTISGVDGTNLLIQGDWFLTTFTPVSTNVENNLYQEFIPQSTSVEYYSYAPRGTINLTYDGPM